MTRPQDLYGCTKRIKTGCGWLYITINEYENKPFEIFIRLGKAGNCAAAWTEALGRMVSLALRNGATQADITRHLTGISCPHPAGGGENKVLSCIDGLASILLKNKELSPPLVDKVDNPNDKVDNNPIDDMGDRGAW